MEKNVEASQDWEPHLANSRVPQSYSHKEQDFANVRISLEVNFFLKSPRRTCTGWYIDFSLGISCAQKQDVSCWNSENHEIMKSLFQVSKFLVILVISGNLSCRWLKMNIMSVSTFVILFRIFSEIYWLFSFILFLPYLLYAVVKVLFRLYTFLMSYSGYFHFFKIFLFLG